LADLKSAVERRGGSTPSTRTKMTRLTKHKSIGLDVDGTLVDGSKSLALQKWVLANQENHEFHLITFRTEHDLYRCPAEELFEDYKIPKELWKSVHRCPFQIFYNYQTLHHHGIIKAIDRGLKPDHPAIQHQLKYIDDNVKYDILQDIANYRTWKAKVCKDNGCTVLVDDYPPDVTPGCRLYDIEFIDVSELKLD
jgi:hypothetical protein